MIVKVLCKRCNFQYVVSSDAFLIPTVLEHVQTEHAPELKWFILNDYFVIMGGE